MNWVDLVIIGIVLFFIMESVGRPLFSELFDLISFIGAFLFSLRFYNLASKYLEDIFSLPHSLANVIGFIAIWYLVEIILFIFARNFLMNYRKQFHFKGSKYLTAVPAGLKGVIFVSILLVLVATFPLQPRIKSDVERSEIGSVLLSKTYKIETPLKSVFGGLADDTLTFLTVHPKKDESLGLGFKTADFYFESDLELRMIELVNYERRAKALGELKYDKTLTQVGRDHSSDMFKKGYFSHYSPEGKSVADRAAVYSVLYLVIGENLAYAPTLELAHTGLMNSPGHKANILSKDYHKVGIGIAKSSDYGLMITQVFSN